MSEEQLDTKLDKLLTDLINYMNALHQDLLKKFDDYPTKKDLDERLKKFATKKDLQKLERKIKYIHEDMKTQNLELKALREFNEKEHKLFHNKFHKVDQYILENPLVQDVKK